MRTPFLFAVALLAACSAAREFDVTPDAAVPLVEAGAPDGELPIADAGILVCTTENTALTCTTVPTESCGDGGYRYRCYGGQCPTADSGPCTVIADDPSARWTDTCCQRLACTRTVGPGDHNCIVEDAGRYEGWECPAGLTPPHDCVTYGPFVANHALDYCCK